MTTDQFNLLVKGSILPFLSYLKLFLPKSYKVTLIIRDDVKGDRMPLMSVGDDSVMELAEKLTSKTRVVIEGSEELLNNPQKN